MDYNGGDTREDKTDCDWIRKGTTEVRSIPPHSAGPLRLYLGGMMHERRKASLRLQGHLYRSLSVPSTNTW